MDYNVGTSAEFANALTSIAANAGGNDIIIFTASFAINESTPLAIIQKNAEFKLVVDGAGFAITASNKRPFFVDSGDVEISNLTISNATAKGGDGGSTNIGGAGGGGMGAGGALFVGDSANVTLTGVTFVDNSAIGGNGGLASASVGSSVTGGAGGGGLQGNGGNAGGGGGGGGGYLNDGGIGFTVGFDTYGGAGGGPNGGRAGADYSQHSSLWPGGDGGRFGGGGGGGANGEGGGDGGDYGGGGGTATQGFWEAAGHGGFGGGGGGGPSVSGHSDTPAPGGFGGGAGGTRTSDGHAVGASGGSAYGGSVFVRDGGQLTIVDADISGGSTTGGLGRAPSRTGSNGSNGDAAGKALYLHGAVVARFATTTTATISSDIAGTGGLEKSGAGKLTLSAANVYTGATIVSAGELIVDGSIATSSGVTVKTGATLSGAGAVSAVSVESGGVIGPGHSPGSMTTKDLTFAAGAKYAVEIAGATAGQFDVLHVNGAVTLGGATLQGSLLGGFAPTAAQRFVIIDNDGADAVTGTFAGAAEGGVVTIGGKQFQITYRGGDGNDVALSLYIPPDSGPPPKPPVAEKDISLAFSAIIGGTLSADDIAKALAPIKAGTATLDGYIDGLIAQVQNTTIPSLVISQFFGSAPSQAHLNDLAKFSAAQLEAYTKAGVLDPRIGPYEALGLGFSDTITFGNKYGSLSDSDFLGKAYQDVFGRAPTIEQYKHFADQILFFENLYAGAGQTEKQSDLHAKGAVLGQMLAVAVIYEADKHTFDDSAASFLKNAAKGQAQWGDGLLI